MHGLVAYDGDSDSGDDNARNSSVLNDKKLKTGPDNDAEPRRPKQKSQIIIKRPQHKPKTVHHPRGHISEELNEPTKTNGDAPEEQPIASTSNLPLEAASTSALSLQTSNPDEISQIRAILRPPEIPGLTDWGIPPEPSPDECEPCDPAIEAKLRQFHALKHPPEPSSSAYTSDDSPPPVPKHFNDSLMSNRSFRNPHLYAKLVEFVDIDERTTNFPTNIWNPYAARDGSNGWDAEKIATYQKSRSEQQSKAQETGKRTHIEFSSSGSHGNQKEKDSSGRYNPYGGDGYGRTKARGGILGGGRGRGHFGQNLGSGRERGKSRWG